MRSAGVAPNKFVAKVASDWNKPDGQFEVLPEAVDAFVAALPVGRLWGVGKKSREQLSALGVETCADLRRFDKIELARRALVRALGQAARAAPQSQSNKSIR